MKLEHDMSGTVEAGLLVRYLHGELDASLTEELREHLLRCEACRARHSRIEADTRRLANTLRATDYDPPARAEWSAALTANAKAGRVGRVRTAAGWIVALLAAAALATTPVRGFLAEWWESLRAAEPTVVETADAGEGTGAGSAALRFPARGASLPIVFGTRQASGTLTVTFTDDSLAAVSVAGGGTERIEVGADLRIMDGPQARASYDVRAPRTVEHVTVRIGDTEPVEVHRADASGPFVFALDSGALVRSLPARDE